MGFVSGLTVFLITWWMVFFMALPFGVRTAEEPEVGHAPSAPLKPKLGKKVLITTLITAVLWLGFYWLHAANVYSFLETAS